MFEKLKADMFFEKLLGRPDIMKAYAMVGPEDSWYDTIKKVHDSLAEIQKLPHEALSVTSHDGLTLKGIYYPCAGSDKTMICAHGYTSHAEREWAFPGLFYHSMGFNVLIPYQRAHGLSQGKYISFGALEPLDMTRWVRKINDLHPEGKIVLHGLSMGGGIVLNLSNREMPNVKCLIADAPNVGIESFFRNVSSEFFKKNAGKVCAFALARFQKEFRVDAADYDSVKIVSGSRYPILLAAGSNEQQEELFQKIRAVNPMQTRILILPGCNHGNGMYKQTALFQSTIREFIADYIN